jgi:hypothetical protein
MVNENFIRKVAPLNKFVIDVFVVYGDSFRIEFYDGDCIDTSGKTQRVVYELSFGGKRYGKYYFIYIYMNFINDVYAIIYNHYVNYMVTDKEEVGYIWDIIVSEYNLIIENKVKDYLGKIDHHLLYFPTYRSYVNRLLTVNLRNGSFSGYNTIKTCHSVPSKYSDKPRHELIFIDHVIY